MPNILILALKNGKSLKCMCNTYFQIPRWEGLSKKPKHRQEIYIGVGL
jgi:hypothetical protein